MNLVHHWTRYSVALKCDDHKEGKNGYLTKPQFPYLQSGDNALQRYFMRIKGDDASKAQIKPGCRLYPLC